VCSAGNNALLDSKNKQILVSIAKHRLYLVFLSSSSSSTISTLGAFNLAAAALSAVEGATASSAGGLNDAISALSGLGACGKGRDKFGNSYFSRTRESEYFYKTNKHKQHLSSLPQHIQAKHFPVPDTKQTLR
jgi:hypothetical protein